MVEDENSIDRTRVHLGEGELKAVHRVFRSGIFVKGPEVESFEKEFAQYCGARHGIALNSGTSALFLSLISIGLKPNDEVITVPNTFVATVNAIVHAGGIPRLIDIDQETMNINVNDLKEKITPNTKVILPVHLYGLPVDMNPITELADKKDIVILEDACQAHGADYRGKKVGSLGDIASFSFYPTKNLTVGGDGGMILTNDKEKADKIRMLRDHGRRSTYEYECFGYNFRLSEILGAIGRYRLGKLDSDISKRRKIAKVYQELLSDLPQVKLPIDPSYAKHVYYLYVPKFEERNKIKAYLQKKGIKTAIDYPSTVNQMKHYQEHYNFKDGMFPVAEALTKEILALPMYPELEDSKVERISAEIHNFYRK